MMNIFSFSRLNLYETCPRRFYLKYVEGMEEPPTEAAELGKAVHRYIELVLHG
jgi:CRISPR/Cas system-associated exonuclease Cas4 (RecB family)